MISYFRFIFAIVTVSVVATKPMCMGADELPNPMAVPVPKILARHEPSEKSWLEAGVLDPIISVLEAHRVTEVQYRRLLTALGERGSDLPLIAKRQCLSPVRQERGPSEKFFISPIKPAEAGGVGKKIRRRSVYALVAHKPGEASPVPSHAKRIDFLSSLPASVEITEEVLFDALLSIEISLRELIKENRNIYYRVAYVGLAHNLSHRFSGHSSDLREVRTDSSENLERHRANPSRKERFFASLFGRGFNATMSSLVFNIPETYLPVVEVLVGIQFNVLAKGNTLLGDNAAWEIINRYIAQSKRIERLRELHLDRLVEDLDDALIDTTLNIAAGG